MILLSSVILITQLPFRAYAAEEIEGIKRVERDGVTYLVIDKDIYLLAKLIYHEARGEGLDGWTGVGEVVVNRVRSPRFPDTVSEVIYQDGQFTGVEALEGIAPTEEMVKAAGKILAGKLRIFGNGDVLYFRNPMKTSNIPSSLPCDWGSHRYYTCINNHAFYLQ